jgi:hypothetical protein
MKQFVFIALWLLFIAGCTKEVPEAPVSPNTGLLTTKAWLYDEYYSGYGTTAQKRVYKRNAPGNSADFSMYQYLFKKDGSLEVKVGDESIYSTWQFVDGEKAIEITGGSGSPTVLKVVALSPSSFDWELDAYFAKMVPR